MGIIMKEDFISKLALKFAPTYRASQGEECYLVELEEEMEPRIKRAYPPWNPIVYFSAIQLDPKEDHVAYEINYFTIWDRDTGGILHGVSGHRWDTERTAILVVGPKDENDPDAFSAREAYYAAHEGIPLLGDESDFYPCETGDHGVIVYLSEGKHASYPKNPCECAPYEVFIPPGYEAKPGEYTIVDMGTLDIPKVPWILHTVSWEEGVDSIHKKLKTRLWNRRTWQKVKKPYEIGGLLWKYQKNEGLPTTGTWDMETLRRIYIGRPDPHLIQNIDKLPPGSFHSILSSSLKGGDIVFLVKAGLSSSEIEGIIQKGLHGKAMRAYVKEEIW